ncbi:MAG: hypothetical protein AVDCRST_MAG91-3587, partial [uncultured Sphingomonadaceae bacterium]
GPFRDLRPSRRGRAAGPRGGPDRPPVALRDRDAAGCRAGARLRRGHAGRAAERQLPPGGRHARGGRREDDAGRLV